MTIKNILKMAVAALMFTAQATMPQDIPSQKTINWSNAAKATFLTGSACAGVWFYYKTIIEPYIIILAKKQGLAYAIDFNKKFIQNNPITALYFASPLFLVAGYAWIARDYVKKIWENKKEEKITTE